MDFTLPEHIETLRLKTRDFVNQKIIGRSFGNNFEFMI